MLRKAPIQRRREGRAEIDRQNDSNGQWSLQKADRAVLVVSWHPRKFRNCILFPLYLLVGFICITYTKKKYKNTLITARRINLLFTFYSFYKLLNTLHIALSFREICSDATWL